MPLQIMAKYNALFQHLLRLKRVNVWSWTQHGRRCGARRALSLLQSRQPIWDVRLHMAHLLLNLQVYMQVCTAGRIIPSQQCVSQVSHISQADSGLWIVYHPHAIWINKIQTSTGGRRQR